MNNDLIYLDYSATTPIADEVLDTYIKVCKRFIGNPNSLHKLGVEAKNIINASTKQIADILHVKESEIIYTSGASESNNMALKGACLKYRNRGNHILTTTLEHSSISETLEYLKKQGFNVEYVQLDANGLVDLKDLEQKIKDTTILVTISSVNSEIGIRQPIEKIGQLLQKYPKVLFHSDITQSIGKEKISLTNVDLASFSAQKFYGMKGIGCLIKKENLLIENLIHGGKSTTTFRSGTPATPLIVSMAKALRLADEFLPQHYSKVQNLSNYLKKQLQELDVIINSNDNCLPHIINFSVKNIKAETMLHALELDNIFISTRTACSTNDYSKAVYAITNDKTIASNSLRISISHLTTQAELDKFISSLKKNIEKLNIKN